MANGEKDRGNIVPLSDKTLETVVRAWKAGKETLTLLVIGTIGILAAFALALTAIMSPIGLPPLYMNGVV